jgi:hypothetical protein
MMNAAGAWRTRTLGLISLLLPLFVYLRTLLPTVGGYGDSAKFQFAGKILALTHPSGFPVYLWLTHVASYLPVGDLAYRMNLISALCGAATVYCLYRILLRVPLPPATALGASLIFAFSATFWSVSLIAEVYTLNALFIAAVILCLWAWREGGRSRSFEWACVLYGLSLGNHLVATIVFPAAIYWVAQARGKFKSEDRYPLRAALFLAAAVLPYAWLYWRAVHPVPYREETIGSLRQFLNFVAGSSFASCRFPLTFKELARAAAPMYGSLLRSQFALPGLLLAVVGFVRLWLRDRGKAIFLTIIIACDLIISLNGTSIEIPIYYVPSYLIVAIWIGCAFMPARERSAERVWRGRGVRGVAPLCLFACALYLFLDHFSLVNLREKTFYRDIADRVLRAVPRGSVILSPNYNWTEVYLYKLLGEGARRGEDVVVLHYWDPHKVRDYLSGRSIDPHFYAAPKRLPERMRVFLHVSSMSDPVIARLTSMGFAVKPVLEQRSVFTRGLKEAPPEQIILLSLRDEGIALLNDDSYDALSALGLKTVASRGWLSGWGFAAILAARDGALLGLQANQFKPVRLRLAKGNAIPRTGIAAPEDVLVESRGIGRGDVSRIVLGGREIQRGPHGLNYARVDARTGAVAESGNVPPARLQSLREAFLLEVVDSGG